MNDCMQQEVYNMSCSETLTMTTCDLHFLARNRNTLIQSAVTTLSDLMQQQNVWKCT